MKTNIKVYPYKAGSASAKALAEAVGGKVLRREGKALRASLLVNWGCSRIDRDIDSKEVLNPVACVGLAANKLRTFQAFRDNDVPTVEWTTDKTTATDWTVEGNHVVVRKVLNGHSGNGIEIVSINDPIPDAPLYTKYTKKKDEYRIHVFDGKVIFQQRKARKKEVPDEEVNWQVRNLAGGFIFANDGVDAPEAAQQAAIKAVKSLGLDFGAADIGVKDDTVVVYEVNTACGLMGKTVEAYANAIREGLGK